MRVTNKNQGVSRSFGRQLQTAITLLRIRPAMLAPLLAASLLADGNEALPDFSSLSLQELSSIKVTSVSKKQQKLSQVAAAVYVISQEEIHRSGLTSVPELLRIVPGLEVARIDSNKWAITSRGFNGRFADKLLVLIDGRSFPSVWGTVKYLRMGEASARLASIRHIWLTRPPADLLRTKASTR